ncbi:MAG: hypothetical protein RMM29_00380 [Planctomycetota bacterium]|nr:hypothetical protein [Planctomycetota bacterium]MDW8372091.1 hypothetical protein [Planctomycetota bacterium]
MKTACGYTLLEVAIASVLFFAAIAIVLESATAAKRLQAQIIVQDDLEQQAEMIIATMSDDLARSGWHFVDTQVAGVSQAQDRQLRYYPMVQIQPNAVDASGFNMRLPWTRLAPSVARPPLPNVLRAVTGTTAASPLPGQASHADQAPLTEDEWRTSFYARSSELVFLRSTVGSWTTDRPGVASRPLDLTLTPAAYLAQLPSRRSLPLLNFTLDNMGYETTAEDWRLPGQHDRLGVFFASGFRETSTGWVERTPGIPYGVTLDGGWYDPSDAESAPIKLSWESMRKPDITQIPATIPGAPTVAARYRAYMEAPERLREYMYAVVRSPVAFGTGRLVRAYRRPQASSIPLGVEVGQRISQVATDSGAIASEEVGMVVDRVLSDHVVRVVFDTYRTVDAGANTVTTLSVNQVRVRLYFARPLATDPRVLISRVVETTLAMRARSSGYDIDQIFNTLGSQPIGISR